MLSADCVIVGAGLAGAATAYELTRRGMRDVVVLDRERQAGFHSSGRNAAMLRQLVADASILPLSTEGAQFIHTAAERWPHGDVYHPGGSIFTASGVGWDALRADLAQARGHGLAAEEWSPARASERVPATLGGHFDGAVFTADDGTVDVHRLLHGFLEEARRAGARVLLASPAEAIYVDPQRRITGLKAGDTEISTPRLVNAAGAWASQVGQMAGATPIRFDAYRRHLAFTGPLEDARADWPYVWDLSTDLYFRPESGGLLLSPCDQDPAPPGVPTSCPSALELLSTKLEATFPALADLPIARTWAGLRVFAADRRFVIGRDPLVDGFFWATGLGGHGVTTCAAVGARVARCILDAGSEDAPAMSPSRFRPDPREEPQAAPG